MRQKGNLFELQIGGGNPCGDHDTQEYDEEMHLLPVFSPGTLLPGTAS